jgi:arsenate reductase
MPALSKPLLLHNPRCSKSRDALAYLAERGVDVEVILYLATPLGDAFLRTLAAKLDGPASSLLRTKEPEYAELGLSDQSPLDEVVRAIAAHPSLLERPILIVGDRAAIGRPLTNFDALVANAPE